MSAYPLRALLLSLLVAASGVTSAVATLAPAAGPAVQLAAASAPDAAAPSVAAQAEPPADEVVLRAAAGLAPAALDGLPADVTGAACTDTDLGVPLCTHSHDAAEYPAAPSGGASASGDGERLGCYGDGTSGPRVRAVYARQEGSPDRLAQVLPDLRRWAAAASAAVDESARRSGGRRYVRFATTPGTSCELAVTSVALPAQALRSFPATIEALQARGLKASWSKYLVWTESSVLCGIATVYADDRPTGNTNDSATPSYARVDRPCWGAAETHELLHMLGAVQRTAPHSTDGFHCHDGKDVMCYADGTARSQQRTVCSGAAVVDCRNDDYFSVAPPAGSYLATRWNTASSSFLSGSLTEPPPAAPRPSGPTSSPQPSAQPTPRPSSSPLALPVPSVPALPAASLPPVLPTPVAALLPLGGAR